MGNRGNQKIQRLRRESGTIFNNLIDTTDRDLINYIIKFLKQGRIRDMKLGGDRI
jgi:hypothetical protein